MNLTSFNKLLVSLGKRSGKFNSDLNLAVLESIKLYYGEANANISVINRVLTVAKVVKGINHAALVQYYKQVIPHVFSPKSKEFTQLNPLSDITKEKALDYIVKHKWYDKADAIETVFDFSKWESRVISKASTLTAAQQRQLVKDLTALISPSSVTAQVTVKRPRQGKKAVSVQTVAAA